MASVFINTTLANVGDGTFNSPYNYFSENMIKLYDKVFISNTSTIPAIHCQLTDIQDKSIVGYDPTVELTYWGDDELPAQCTGTTINADKEEYSLAINIDDVGMTPNIFLMNLNFVGWTALPINIGMDQVTMVNVTYSAADRSLTYTKGWKRVTIKLQP